MYSVHYVKLSVRLPNYSGSETVKRNSSISRPYIFYQMFTVGSSILGPASVTLMIAGRSQILIFLWFVSNSKTASNYVFIVFSTMCTVVCHICLSAVFVFRVFSWQVLSSLFSKSLVHFLSSSHAFLPCFTSSFAS